MAGAAPVLYWLILTGQTTAIALCNLDDGISIHEARPILLVRILLGFLSYRAVFDDHYPVAGSAQNGIGQCLALAHHFYR